MNVKISEFPSISSVLGDDYCPIIRGLDNYIIPLSSLYINIPFYFNGSYLSGNVLLGPIVTTSTPTASQTLSGSAYYDETHYVTPTGSLSALTWTLPRSSDSRVGQIKTFLSTQNITTLTVNVGNGGTKVGNSLTTALANEAYSYQCVSTSGNGTWLRLA